jgi:hypothetical protein
MRRHAASGAQSVSDAMSSYGKLLLAIRKKFGHEDLTLEEKDLFRVIFNDEIDTLIELDSASAA